MREVKVEGIEGGKDKKRNSAEKEKAQDRSSDEDSILSQERCYQLEYSNDLYFFRLEQAEVHEEGLKKEIRELKETLEETHQKFEIRTNEVESFQDELNYQKCENELIEEEIENK